MEWQPIETAPVGRYVLVTERGRNGHQTVMATQYEPGRWNHTGGHWTDWMEIPKAPTTEP